MRAQAFGEEWFQVLLLERGLARVAISPDRNECAPDLYEAEQRGRAEHAGLWALSAARRAPPEAMKDASGGSFQIVDGWVTNVGRSDGRVLHRFRQRRVSGIFSAVILPEDRRAFRALRSRNRA